MDGPKRQHVDREEILEMLKLELEYEANQTLNELDKMGKAKDPSEYERAAADGCYRFSRMWMNAMASMVHEQKFKSG